MAFVKLDCGMLDSTIWADPDATKLFITALLMAEPKELIQEESQIEVRTLKETGFKVPPGWYGFVAAAGSGIASRAKMELEVGLAALERLGAPELDSRTPDFEGRRLVRVNGGYVALNYAKYREKDHTSAERSRRYRERKMKSKPKGKIKVPFTAANEAAFVKAHANGDVPEQERLTNTEPEKCAICNQPLAGETWVDDDQYGDAHERCIQEKG